MGPRLPDPGGSGPFGQRVGNRIGHGHTARVVRVAMRRASLRPRCRGLHIGTKARRALVGSWIATLERVDGAWSRCRKTLHPTRNQPSRFRGNAITFPVLSSGDFTAVGEARGQGGGRSICRSTRIGTDGTFIFVPPSKNRSRRSRRPRLDCHGSISWRRGSLATHPGVSSRTRVEATAHPPDEPHRRPRP